MSTLKVDTLQNSVGENLVFGNKNLLINGSQSVWQRSTSETGITVGGYQTADRWRIGGTVGGTWTQSRSTDVPSAQGFGYSLKMDCTTADASPAASNVTTFQQRLEGQNLQHLLKGTSSAKKLTLSFWVKSNKTGTYIIEISDEDNSRHICQSYTISSASTWEKKELTFDGDTSGTLDNDNAESLRIIWWLASGSDTNSGTLATSWASIVEANRAVGQVNLADSTSNEWYITGCQLEVGSKATDFEFEPYDKILSRCYRYYSKMITDSAGRRCATAVGDNTTNAVVAMVLPTAMRALPSIVESNMVLRNNGTNYTINTISSISPDLADRNYFSFTCESSGVTGTRTYNVRHNAADAYIDFDSEL
jgi:hypothetical protein